MVRILSRVVTITRRCILSSQLAYSCRKDDGLLEEFKKDWMVRGVGMREGSMNIRVYIVLSMVIFNIILLGISDNCAVVRRCWYTPQGCVILWLYVRILYRNFVRCFMAIRIVGWEVYPKALLSSLPTILRTLSNSTIVYYISIRLTDYYFLKW